MKVVPMSLYFLAIIGFFMPFALVSCGSSNIESVSGIQIAFGNGQTLSTTNNTTQTSNNTSEIAAKTISSSVNIYEGEDFGGKILWTCPLGTSLIINGQTDNYYSVEMSDGSLGFVRKSDVEFDSPSVGNSASSRTPISDASLAIALFLTVLSALAQLFGIWFIKFRSSLITVPASIVAIVLLMKEKIQTDNTSLSWLNRYPGLHIETQYGFWITVICLGLSLVSSIVQRAAEPGNIKRSISEPPI